jgi:hypothetical protein
MLKTRVAHGYCSRDLVADACRYAKHLRNSARTSVTAPEFQPALEQQLADVRCSSETRPGAGGLLRPPATLV